jgi:serine incorporator 1/3
VNTNLCFSAIPASALEEERWQDDDDDDEEVVGETRDDERTGTRYNVRS